MLGLRLIFSMLAKHSSAEETQVSLDKLYAAYKQSDSLLSSQLPKGMEQR